MPRTVSGLPIIILNWISGYETIFFELALCLWVILHPFPPLWVVTERIRWKVQVAVPPQGYWAYSLL